MLKRELSDITLEARGNPKGQYLGSQVSDGSANLTADCNQVRWTYTLEDGSLTFNTLGPSTSALGGDDLLDQLFLSKLGTGGTVSVDDGRLVLELKENADRMVFDSGGPAGATPATLPEAGGALVAAPWAVTAPTGLAALGTGMALRRRKR